MANIPETWIWPCIYVYCFKLSIIINQYSLSGGHHQRRHPSQLMTNQSMYCSLHFWSFVVLWAVIFDISYTTFSCSVCYGWRKYYQHDRNAIEATVFGNMLAGSQNMHQRRWRDPGAMVHQLRRHDCSGGGDAIFTIAIFVLKRILALLHVDYSVGCCCKFNNLFIIYNCIC